MSLSGKQLGVLKGMLSGLGLSFLLLGGAVIFNPLGFGTPLPLVERSRVLGLSLLLPSVCLAVSIGRLAKLRFFSPEDIDGSGLTAGSAESKILQSLLQNTLEQLCLALGVYTVWVLTAPATWLSTVPAASLLFSLGRLFFFMTYRRGAAARALGFSLTLLSQSFAVAGHGAGCAVARVRLLESGRNPEIARSAGGSAALKGAGHWHQN